MRDLRQHRSPAQPSLQILFFIPVAYRFALFNADECFCLQVCVLFVRPRTLFPAGMWLCAFVGDSSFQSCIFLILSFLGSVLISQYLVEGQCPVMMS